MVYRNDLTRIHVTDEFSANRIECACLAGHHVAFAKFRNGQRMKTVLVAAGVDTVWSHYHQRESALNHVQGIDDVNYPVFLGRVFLYEMGKQLAVRCGLQQTAPTLQIQAQFL